jgi:hypothetical protein
MASSDIGDAGLCAIRNEAVTPTRMTWKPSHLIDRLRPSPMETHLSHNNLELHDLPAFLGLVHLCGKPERRALRCRSCPNLTLPLLLHIDQNFS